MLEFVGIRWNLLDDGAGHVGVVRLSFVATLVSAPHVRLSRSGHPLDSGAPLKSQRRSAFITSVLRLLRIGIPLRRCSA